MSWLEKLNLACALVNVIAFFLALDGWFWRRRNQRFQADLRALERLKPPPRTEKPQLRLVK